MEDTLLNVFVMVMSLLLHHNVIHEQNDDTIVSMQDYEHVILKETAKLEQGEHTVAIELPYSNQEASQSHRREGDTSDVQQIAPNVKTKVLHEEQMSPVGDQNDFRQKTFAPDDQEILSIDKDKWSVHMANEGLPNDQGSTVDQNVSQGESERPEKPKNDRIDTRREHQATGGLLVDQKIPTSSQKLAMETQGKLPINQESTFILYLRCTLTLISFCRFFKMFLRRVFKAQERMSRHVNVSEVVSNLDYKTLTIFHNQCVLVPQSYSWHTCEFVEGFVNDLMETVRTMSTAGSDIEMEDFIGIGSLYEQWASRKKAVCDIHVLIIPPNPYSFESKLLKVSRGSATQYSCRIKIVKSAGNSTNCHCSNSNLDEDMLCLLHPDNKNDDHAPENLINDMCQENSSYLAKTNVMKWFKNTLMKAWKEISHKYEFELMFWNRENPGSFKVRFRSGRVILFKLTPVVRFKDSEVHLMSYLPSDTFSDTYWPVCFARYENALLQHITKTLPENACHFHCLQILSFLHAQQTSLTGPCGLTSYHFKTVLLHLLVKKTLSWEPEQMSWRIIDLLTFLQQKLQAKMLEHALVANPLIPSEIGIPEVFRVGKPVNLFLPLLSNNTLYLKTNTHFLEMIRNMPVLIHEYGSVGKVLQQSHF